MYHDSSIFAVGVDVTWCHIFLEFCVVVYAAFFFTVITVIFFEYIENVLVLILTFRLIRSTPSRAECPVLSQLNQKVDVGCFAGPGPLLGRLS